VSGFDFHAQVREHIARTGRSVLGVGADPAFTYTIGNHLAGKPELIVFGINPEDAQGLLNEISNRADAAELGTTVEVIDLGGKFPVRAIPCPDWAKAEYSIQAGRYLRTEAYRLVQLLVCDPTGRFPDEPGCAPPYGNVPVLRLQLPPARRP
jgi:hypothetical protein